jgi:cytochrome c peroxidase
VKQVFPWLPGLALLCVLAGFWFWPLLRAPAPWSQDELALLQSLSLEQLPALPPDPSNAVADDPRAARLGQHLFYDRRLSSSGQFSCSSCHRPEQRFTDGLQQARAEGKTLRHTPSIVGSAWSPWQYWDGRKDSQWAQALAPLEDPQEQGSNRMRLVRLLQQDALYRESYSQLFGPLPDFSDRARFPEDAGPAGSNPDWQSAWTAMTESDRMLVNAAFANMGKALAAYERLLQPSPTRFDAYIAALGKGDRVQSAALMNNKEQRGLRLFIGEARCLECHNGPLFTNHEFHNTGLLPLPGELPDQGRRRALDSLREDPFSCTGPYSDAAPAACTELRYMRTGVELLGALRTPSLRNLEGTAPYMHQGQLATLRDVLAHYNVAELAVIGHNEAEPLGLSRRELRWLEAFLHTLAAPVAGDPALLQPLSR